MAWSFRSDTNPAMSMAATWTACHATPGRPDTCPWPMTRWSSCSTRPRFRYGRLSTASAVRGGGASVDGVPLRPSGCTEARAALVGVSGLPSRSLGWRQFRALGAAALDLCAVADGTLDAFVDCTPSAHGAWDYLGATLICLEAGAIVGDAHGRGLATLDPLARRTPVAAATQPLFDALVATRRQLGE